METNTKYYKRLHNNNSYSEGIIYPDDGSKDEFECTVQRSVECHPERWQEVSLPYYYSDFVITLGGYSTCNYFEETPPKGVEISVDQLTSLQLGRTSDEIFNTNTKTMDEFAVKVNPTTSRILQELAFKNGWRWNSGNDKVINTHIDHLAFGFENDKTISYALPSGISFFTTRGVKQISLEQAIDRIENTEEPITIGEYEVEFGDHDVTIGCQTYSKDFVQRLTYALDKLNGFEYIKVAGEKINKVKVKEIYEKLAESK